MNYLLLICAGDESTPESEAAMRRHTPAWVDEMDGRGVRLLGKQLEDVTSAKTVRVRDGETLVVDGPFAESKEVIAGLDVIECENLDEAIEVAIKHPVSWFHSIEVRPFLDYGDYPGSFLPESVPEDPEASMRYMLMVCVDGVPEEPEVEERIMHDINDWRERIEASGRYVYGHALQPASTATTVRAREGQTLLTDGPFTETREFIGGFALLSCESEAEALEIAAQHPIARFHMIEVRPFVDYGHVN